MVNKILFDIDEVRIAVNLSQTTIRKNVLDGTFPAPYRFGTRVLWRVNDLNHWAEQLVANPVIKKETRGRKRMAI